MLKTTEQINNEVKKTAIDNMIENAHTPRQLAPLLAGVFGREDLLQVKSRSAHQDARSLSCAGGRVAGGLMSFWDFPWDFCEVLSRVSGLPTSDI